MIVNCISLIVAYVPLGLPVSVTFTLSLIAAKMVRPLFHSLILRSCIHALAAG
jgi:hypothetical protein